MIFIFYADARQAKQATHIQQNIRFASPLAIDLFQHNKYRKCSFDFALLHFQVPGQRLRAHTDFHYLHAIIGNTYFENGFCHRRQANFRGNAVITLARAV